MEKLKKLIMNLNELVRFSIARTLKHFAALASCLNALHNYFDDPSKSFLDFYPAKFLNTLRSFHEHIKNCKSNFSASATTEPFPINHFRQPRQTPPTTPSHFLQNAISFQFDRDLSFYSLLLGIK